MKDDDGNTPLELACARWGLIRKLLTYSALYSKSSGSEAIAMAQTFPSLFA
jgi:hypothetical protein